MQYEKKDKIGILTLNRSEVMNAINLELARELYRLWKDFNEDPQAAVLVVTGCGDKAFCVGADLKERSQTGQDIHVSQGLRMEGLLRRVIADTQDTREGMQAFQQGRKPTFKGR